LRHAHFGLNHCSWLYDFRDADDLDRTDEVIELAAAAAILPVNVEAIRTEKAVPVAYLRLFYERGAALAEQLSRDRTRGADVLAWSEALDAAYLSANGPDSTTIAHLLACRRMDWHDKAVMPAMSAWIGMAPAELVVNVMGVADGIATELPCQVNGGVVTPLPQPSLPPSPRELHSRLSGYERAALALVDAPDEDEIAEVLFRHPLIPDQATAARLGRDILARMDTSR
jgi:alpha-galactosidase/6-phospho-beta-glucosidase family protein